MEKKLRLKHVYIKALAEGLTAKEAACKYNCNYRSLLTRGSEHGLPPLESHWKWDDQRLLKEMSISELQSLQEKCTKLSSQIQNAINEKQITKV